MKTPRHKWDYRPGYFRCTRCGLKVKRHQELPGIYISTDNGVTWVKCVRRKYPKCKENEA